jgi:hypothetical protein
LMLLLMGGRGLRVRSSLRGGIGWEDEVVRVM